MKMEKQFNKKIFMISLVLVLIGCFMWFSRDDHYSLIKIGNKVGFFPIAHLFLGFGCGLFLREIIKIIKFWNISRTR